MFLWQYVLVGSSRAHWSCYFLPETSQECRDRAFELLTNKEAWEKRVITSKDSYSSKEIWSGHIPRHVYHAKRFSFWNFCELIYGKVGRLIINIIFETGYGASLGCICSQLPKLMGVWLLIIAKWIEDGGGHRYNSLNLFLSYCHDLIWCFFYLDIK